MCTRILKHFFETPFTTNKFVQGFFETFLRHPLFYNLINVLKHFCEALFTLQFNNKFVPGFFETFFKTPFTLQFNNNFF